MTRVIFRPDEGTLSTEVFLSENETLLDGLLRTGFEVPYSCKAGACQSCMMHCTGGTLPAAAQRGLKPGQIEQGFFLACSCVPKETLEVRPLQLTQQKLAARVIEKSELNKDVFRLRIEKPTDFRAGQFFTLWKDKHTARSYSIASLPSENFIEFHIKRIANGAFSSWAWEQLRTGDSLTIQGPLGNCFYTRAAADSPLFLCGIGTGLAPLYGITRDALTQNHSAEISLYLGGKTAESFYLVDELIALQNKHPNLHIKFICQDAAGQHLPELFEPGDIYQTVKSDLPNFKGMKVFLCGAESFVRKMKKQCFMAGASMQDIAADPFIAFAR